MGCFIRLFSFGSYSSLLSWRPSRRRLGRRFFNRLATRPGLEQGMPSFGNRRLRVRSSGCVASSSWGLSSVSASPTLCALSALAHPCPNRPCPPCLSWPTLFLRTDKGGRGRAGKGRQGVGGVGWRWRAGEERRSRRHRGTRPSMAQDSSAPNNTFIYYCLFLSLVAADSSRREGPVRAGG